MACFHPMTGWRWSDGEFRLARDEPVRKGFEFASEVKVPCGTCIGCRTAYARGWALRGLLELAEYSTASFVTLTYNDTCVPPTLSVRDFQLWMKRFRKRLDRPLRYIASGEYGERYLRPHYHAILYGVSPDESAVAESWRYGITQSAPVGAGAVAYVAGYVVKKIGLAQVPYEFIDLATGELVTYQPEFRLMSRGRGAVKGIGCRAFEKFRSSFAQYGVMNGAPVGLPRYFVDRYISGATRDELLAREDELTQRVRSMSVVELRAAEEFAFARHALYRSQRGTL